jgi:hypothetical protein
VDRIDELVMSRETIIQVFRTQISVNYAHVIGGIISVPFDRIGRMSVLLCVVFLIQRSKLLNRFRSNFVWWTYCNFM